MLIATINFIFDGFNLIIIIKNCKLKLDARSLVEIERKFASDLESSILPQFYKTISRSPFYLDWRFRRVKLKPKLMHRKMRLILTKGEISLQRSLKKNLKDFLKFVKVKNFSAHTHMNFLHQVITYRILILYYILIWITYYLYIRIFFFLITCTENKKVFNTNAASRRAAVDFLYWQVDKIALRTDTCWRRFSLGWAFDRKITLTFCLAKSTRSPLRAKRRRYFFTELKQLHAKSPFDRSFSGAKSCDSREFDKISARTSKN